MAPRRSRRVPAAVLRPRHRPAAAEERGMEEPWGCRTSSGGGEGGAVAVAEREGRGQKAGGEKRWGGERKMGREWKKIEMWVPWRGG